MELMSSPAKLLWIDLEMTGLDPVSDRILEVAAVASDWDFHEMVAYQSAVRVSPRLVNERMEIGKQFWDCNPAARNALLKQNLEKGRSAQTIENELLEFVDKNFDKQKPVLLAGNSIHQDRKFIENTWKRLNQRLHYRMLDVSAWKVVFEGKYKKKFAKPQSHRALDDIRGSISELEYYLKKVSPRDP